MATQKATTKAEKKVEPVYKHETFVSIRKSFTESGEVKDKIKVLYELQQVDQKLDDIYQLRGELPEEVENLEKTINAMSDKQKEIRESVAELEKKVSDLKIVKEESLAQSAKYKEQLGNIKNSREYDSLSKEIETKDLDAQVAQKRIEESTNLIEERKKDIEAIEEKKKIRVDDLEHKRADLKEIVAVKEKDEKALLEQRKQYADNIDARTMNAYERIRNRNANRLAVVALYNGNSCGGCFCQITPQSIEEVKSGEKLVICEYCGRILVEDPNAPGSKPIESENQDNKESDKSAKTKKSSSK